MHKYKLFLINSPFKKFRWRNLWLIFLIFLVVTVWVFSGWPQIWNNPPFPPKIQEARAAHTFDAKYGNVYDTTAPHQFNYTCGSGTTLLTLVISIQDSAVRTGGAPTYNGVELQLAGTMVHTVGPETNVEHWYMLNPPTGSALQISIPNTGTAKEIAPVASSYKAASGYTSALKEVLSNSGVSKNPTGLTHTGLASGDVIVTVVGTGAQTWAPTARTGTQLYDTDTGSEGIGTQYLIKTDTSNTAMGWTFGTSDDWAIVSASFTEVPIITTLGPGTDPATATVAPESGIRDAGAFTFQTSVGTDSITALTVTLAGAGTTPYDGLSEVRITSDNGETTYFTAISNPSSNTLNFSGTPNIPVSATQTQFKIRVTPKTHAAMDSPPGAEYNLSPYVSDWTSGNPNTKAGLDSNTNTLTIDNLSPDNTTNNSGYAGYTQVTIYYTTPADSDLNSVVVLRDTSAVTDNPVEGATYTVGNTIGTATVACVDTTVNPSTEDSCIDTGLTGGTPYHYKIFAKDNNGNYATGIVPTGSPFTPETLPTYGNIDSTYKYSWGENIGWMNWRPNFGGVTVYNECLTGYIWAENVGWIKVGDDSCTGDDCCQSGTTKGYENDSNSTDDDGDGKIDDWGVNNDGNGNLSGYAWGENVGWINFDDTSANNYHQVVIDSNGYFTNYAWGENVGWINMNCANTEPSYCGTVDFKVKTDWQSQEFSTAIKIRAQNYTTSVSNIIFPEAGPGTTVSQPYNNVDGENSPQAFGDPGRPVATLYNGGASTLTIWYNIASFNNNIVSEEYYLINAPGAACENAGLINNLVAFGGNTSTGITIGTTGDDMKKDLYLKITLSALAGKTGTSTLTILGEL